MLERFVDRPRPLVMAVLNVTPDSFSDGGRFLEPEAALRRAEQLIAEGADILDIGGESSRPGASPVPEAEERRRVVPVIREIRRRFSIPISIDTVKASVAQEALEAGADWINDVSALRDDPRLAQVAATSGAPVVLMHRAGTAAGRYLDFAYDDVLEEVERFFAERLAFAREVGIDPERIVLDPGIGFGKSARDNCRLIAELARLRRFGRPLLIGTSRKSFLGKLAGVPVEERLPGTLASVVLAALHGADLVRVHDVAATRQALLVTRAIVGASP